MQNTPPELPRNAKETAAWLPPHVLNDLKADTLAQWPSGLDDELQSRIAMALPDIIDELTLRRAADLTIVRLPSTSRDALATATRLLRSPGTITRKELQWACQTVLQLSKDAALRSAAQDVLAQVTPAA